MMFETRCDFPDGVSLRAERIGQVVGVDELADVGDLPRNGDKGARKVVGLRNGICRRLELRRLVEVRGVDERLDVVAVVLQKLDASIDGFTEIAQQFVCAGKRCRTSAVGHAAREIRKRLAVRLGA